MEVRHLCKFNRGIYPPWAKWESEKNNNIHRFTVSNLLPQAKKQTKGTYSKPIAKKAEKKEREHPKGTADKKTIKQLLGELYGDKKFLDKLLGDQSRYILT